MNPFLKNYAGVFCLISCLILLPACKSEKSHPGPAAAPAQPGRPAKDAVISAIPNCPDQQAAEAERTRKFLEDNQARYEQAIDKARQWLDRLDVDPFKMRENRVKGKKKLVEALDAYARLYRILSEDQKPQVLERFKDLAAITYEPRYHDMQSIDDDQFKEDSTSYLRAAYLMEELGLDTALYRAEIQKILPRLNGHLNRRGSHQLMAFHWYYQHFGLPEPFPLEQHGFGEGIITSRRSPYKYNMDQAYAMTHEIFVPYQYGDKLDADFFSEDDKQYLRQTLDRLTVHYIMENEPDLTGELVLCIRYLKFTDLPVYREALDFILGAQNQDGSWGNYEKARPKLGEYVNQNFYLHTTGIAVDTLSMAFYFRN